MNVNVQDHVYYSIASPESNGLACYNPLGRWAQRPNPSMFYWLR